VEAAVRRIGLGLPGILGGVLLLAGLVFFLLVLRPLDQKHSALLDQLQRAAKRSAPGDARLLAVSAPQGKLASFYGFFRRDDALTDYLARLHAVGLQAGVEPRTAEYRLAESRTLRLDEYSISMPVAGSYAQVRTFVEGAMNEIPVLTLEHVSLRRKRAADHVVEADVRFTLFIAKP
jgi:hypothetical protein